MNFQLAIFRQLNAGGNGDLFLAHRNDNGETVVIKYLREHHLPHARRAFEREVRVLKRGIRGVIPVFFADMKAERPYYVMPYITGGSLTKYAGRLTETQLCGVAAELARTLAALHDAFVMHGDIKPDNIMLSPEGRLQVADPLGNGIGCTILFSHNRGGTPGYWAPEITHGRPISRTTDAFSYGATLYHLWTGIQPRDGAPLNLTSRSFTKAPKIRPIIAACCQSNPGARPNMQEVLRMLAGEKWADIQVARKQMQQLLAAGVIGGIVLLAAASAT